MHGTKVMAAGQADGYAGEMSNSPIASPFNAVIQRTPEWWIGWIEEIPGVNSQGVTREELIANLQSALEEALSFAREDARAEAQGPYEETAIPV